MKDSRDQTPKTWLSRRRFLKTTGASAAALAVAGDLSAIALESAESPAHGRITKLSEHLVVYHGPVNVGIVCDPPQALLIDCGDGTVADALGPLGINKVQTIAFTHHHRDQACGAYELADVGAKIVVPGAEREYFADPTKYWNDETNRWRVYRSFRPHSLMLAEPLEVDQAVADGHQFTFGPATIRVINTPGHTEGSVSYVVQVDDLCVVFCGDAIYDDGQVWDLYSLQQGFSNGGRTIGGYHGFLGDRPQLVESLQRIKGLEPDLLVPSHGHLMKDATRAVNTLVERFESCYENYVAISALRHYFPELFTDYEGRRGQMPIRPGIQPPDCLRHFGTTWMLVSKTGAAFVMDVGSTRIVDQIKTMLAEGEIKSVEGLWVTHYHYDHTDGIPTFQQEFDCPCFTDRRLAQVLTNPAAWRLPCLAPEPIQVHRPMENGQSWQWHEFKMTSYFYPGQTLYHDALLVEADGVRMFFVGDSHTMSGIDDYCAYNRNWLGRDVGFQYCISLIQRLEPTHIFNCHVADAFTFTPAEIHFMRKNLDQREQLFGRLVPWAHANYGTDPSWVRCDPYKQQRRPGSRVRMDVVLTNHSTEPETVACRAVLPSALGGRPAPWVQAQVPAKTEKAVPLQLDIPTDAKPGRHVVTIDVKYGPWQLPQFAEAIIDVASTNGR